MGQPDRTWTAAVEARQQLLALSLRRRRDHSGAAPEPVTPGEEPRILEARLRRLGRHQDLRRGLDRQVFRQLQQKVPRPRRLALLYSRLQQDDSPAMERDRRIGQTITVGCSTADRTRREGRHYRAGRLGV